MSIDLTCFLFATAITPSFSRAYRYSKKLTVLWFAQQGLPGGIYVAERIRRWNQRPFLIPKKCLKTSIIIITIIIIWDFMKYGVRKNHLKRKILQNTTYVRNRIYFPLSENLRYKYLDFYMDVRHISFDIQRVRLE